MPLPTGEEIDRRLRIVSELRNLCLSLGKARLLEREEDGRPDEGGQAGAEGSRKREDGAAAPSK